MANVMTKRGSLDNVVTFEHYCDTLADLQKIPKDQMSLGSVAIVLQGQNNELEVYMATTGKQWVPLLEGGGSDESSGVYDLLHICAQDEYDSSTLIPTVEEPNDTTIYLVPGGSGNDLYQEWIYVDDEWEKFGVGTMEIPDVVTKANVAPIEATTTSTAAHAVGEMFWLNGTLYKATSAIAIGGTITVGTNCEAVVVGDELVKKIPNITYGEPEVVLAETTLNFVKDGDNDWYYAEIEDFSFFGNADNRTKFIVELDGVEYDDLYLKKLGRIAANDIVYSSYFIGDGLCIGMERKNNCPFCIQYYFNGTKSITRITAYNSQASHTIKISVQNYENVVIPPKESYYEYGRLRIITIGSGSNAYGIGDNIGNISGGGSFAIGSGTTAAGDISFASGLKTTAAGLYSFASGRASIASGDGSHAEGGACTASNLYDHAEGFRTTASGGYSHAENQDTIASGLQSHAEGNASTASGRGSHAEGSRSVASGDQSHAEGVRTIANHKMQHVFGNCNIADPSAAQATERGTYVEIVGNGTADNARSNARALDWSGNEYLAGDVYVGCGTDSTGGTKLVKQTDIADSNNVGLVKGGTGIGITNTGQLYLINASDTNIKNGTIDTKAIVPYTQHAATFYGLAKAAGDSTQSASDNAVGTYTNAAKTAIRNMLGVETTTMFVEEVSGTAVTITGEPNTRYVCGEVLTISITPPVTGTIDVIFTSGSTLAVLTLPNTVKMPEWWTGVETGYTYEIVITDGVYGSVMAWLT